MVLIGFSGFLNCVYEGDVPSLLFLSHSRSKTEQSAKGGRKGGRTREKRRPRGSMFNGTGGLVIVFSRE